MRACANVCVKCFFPKATAVQINSNDFEMSPGQADLFDQSKTQTISGERGCEMFSVNLTVAKTRPSYSDNTHTFVLPTFLVVYGILKKSYLISATLLLV